MDIGHKNVKYGFRDQTIKSNMCEWRFMIMRYAARVHHCPSLNTTGCLHSRQYLNKAINEQDTSCNSGSVAYDQMTRTAQTESECAPPLPMERCRLHPNTAPTAFAAISSSCMHVKRLNCE